MKVNMKSRNYTWGLGLNVAYSQFMKKAASLNNNIIEMKNHAIKKQERKK